MTDAEVATTARKVETKRKYSVFSLFGALAVIVLGAIYGLPMAILVLAAGALFGSIALFWASLRTLTIREERKGALEETDLEPYRTKAEEAVRAHLAKKGIEPGRALANTESYESAKNQENGVDIHRIACTHCDESNEHDARFCKRCGVALHATRTAESGPASTKETSP